jgi:hypothetical protein
MVRGGVQVAPAGPLFFYLLDRTTNILCVHFRTRRVSALNIPSFKHGMAWQQLVDPVRPASTCSISMDMSDDLICSEKNAEDNIAP